MPNTPAGSHRRGTTWTASFPNLPNFSNQPAHVELFQTSYHHDVIRMKWLDSSDYWLKYLKTGEPVKFTWDNPRGLHSWYGYVNHVTHETAGSRKREMMITCVGSSFPLKEHESRIFKHKTIPEVVEIIAKEHGFKYDGENHGRRFDQLSISSHSYWEWMVTNAKKIGFGLRIDGMTLVFKSIDKLIAQDAQSVPILSMHGTQLPTNTQLFDRTLNYFKVMHGEHVETGVHHRASKVVGGVDPVSGKSFTSKTSPKTVGRNTRTNPSDVLFTEVTSTHVVTSSASAKHASDGAAHLARFAIPARIRCQGDFRVRPFAPVYVDGTTAETDGYWIVKEAVHRFDRVGDYEMEVTVLTDGLGKTATSSGLPSAAGMVGVVNLGAALANPSASNAQPKVVLVTTGSMTNQSAHGYLTTPAKWKAK